MIEFFKYNENHYSIKVPNFDEIGVINRVGGQFVISIHNRDLEISEAGMVEILSKVRELNASIRPSVPDEDRPMPRQLRSDLLDVDGKQVLVIEFGGTLHIGEVTLTAPVDPSKDLLTQATDEFQDAFM